VTFIIDSLFWALVNMSAIVGGSVIVSGSGLGRCRVFGVMIVVTLKGLT
jgi:hypothetical protein